MVDGFTERIAVGAETVVDAVTVASCEPDALLHPNSELSWARVATPKLPVPLERPYGARIVLAYFSWNAAIAAVV
jgi:hypothetical protein